MGQGSKVKTSTSKIRKSWGYDVQHGDDHESYCIGYLKVAKIVNLKRYHKEKQSVTVW